MRPRLGYKLIIPPWKPPNQIRWKNLGDWTRKGAPLFAPGPLPSCKVARQHLEAGFPCPRLLRAYFKRVYPTLSTLLLAKGGEKAAWSFSSSCSNGRVIEHQQANKENPEQIGHTTTWKRPFIVLSYTKFNKTHTQGSDKRIRGKGRKKINLKASVHLFTVYTRTIHPARI